MSKPLITELGYLGFEVSDMPAWERFAGEVLGLGVSEGPAGTRRLRMDANQYRFILTEGPADDCAFLGWQSPDHAALEAFGQHLDRQGVQWAWASPEVTAQRSVQRLLQFTDPSGLRHEAYCGPQLACDRFASSKVASGFVTGDGGLGHAVFGLQDPAGGIDFVQRIFGLRTTDLIRVQINPQMAFEVCFMHLNPRHHSFAVAPAAPGSRRRMHHFMVEVNSVEDVGFARDRCLAMGLPVPMDIGQHPNDRMISFYGQTPSGFLVEFGYGGVLVDTDWQLRTYSQLSEWGHRPNNEVAATGAPVPAASKAGQPVAVDGTWKVVVQTPMGDNEVVFDFKAEGGALFGEMRDKNETNRIADGKVDGTKLSWRSKVSQPMPMELEFTATVEGDNISGGAKSPFGTAPFKGQRG